MLKSVGEHAMLFDLKPGDTAFFPTTLGWMMWNFLVNYLGTGAKIVCYDGSPFYPDTGRLWRLAAEEGVTVLGLGSSYIEACRKNGVQAHRRRRPQQSADDPRRRLGAVAGRLRLCLRELHRRGAAQLGDRRHRDHGLPGGR